MDFITFKITPLFFLCMEVVTVGNCRDKVFFEKVSDKVST